MAVWCLFLWMATVASQCAEGTPPSEGDSRAPKVKITMPAAGAKLSWNAGATKGQTLIASVTTAPEPFNNTSLSWTFRPQSAAGTPGAVPIVGNNINLPPLDFIGPTTITARYTNAFGSGLDQITIDVTNELPTAHITYPPNGAIFHKGQTITCRGYADDPDEKIPGERLSWILSPPTGIISQLGTGKEVPALLNDTGTVQLELIVDDARGQSQQKKITFEVIDSGSGFPSARISKPEEGQAFTAGTPVTFVGTAVGANGASLPDSQLQWSSDKDGPLGTGSVIQKTLTSGSPAVHVITLSVTDPQTSNVATDKVTITVNDRVL